MPRQSGPSSPTRKVDQRVEHLECFQKALKAKPVAARDMDRDLTSSLRERGFRMDGKNLRALTAPYLLTINEVRELTRSVRTISNLLEQVVELALSSVTFMDQVGVSPNIEEMAVGDTPSRLAIEFARYDFIPTPGGPRFLEFNVDSPAGSSFSHVLDTEFQKLEQVRKCGMHSCFPSAPTVDLYCDALMAAYKEHGRATEKVPNVAVVDFEGTPTLPEQEMVVATLIERGHHAKVIDPREFEFNTSDKGLYHDGVRYHLVCRRALVPELARRRVLVGPFLRSLRYADVVVVNPLRSRLAGNKGVLEILTSQAFERFFTAAENQEKVRLLPWTRKLVDRRTDHLGREIDLLPFVASRPDKFVLKPGGGFGGQDVVLGPHCDKQEWLKRLDEGVNRQGVVQEYVPVKEHVVPMVEGRQTIEQNKFLTLGAFAVRGEYAGCIARVSDDPIVNVKRGGGVVPVLEIGGRSKTGPIEAARPRRRRTTRNN